MKRYLAWGLALLIAASGCAAPASPEVSDTSEASPSAVITNGDILQLGTDTSFLVVSLAK